MRNKLNIQAQIMGFFYAGKKTIYFEKIKDGYSNGYSNGYSKTENNKGITNHISTKKQLKTR